MHDVIYEWSLSKNKRNVFMKQVFLYVVLFSNWFVWNLVLKWRWTNYELKNYSHLHIRIFLIQVSLGDIFIYLMNALRLIDITFQFQTTNQCNLQKQWIFWGYNWPLYKWAALMVASVGFWTKLGSYPTLSQRALLSL